MKPEKIHPLMSFLFVLLISSLSACSQDGEGQKLFKTYNQDKDGFIDDQEFYQAVADMSYFEMWNTDGDQVLSEDEWSAGLHEFLGGYKVSAVERFGEWDLNGDSQISVEEFREGLFEVVDKDQNREISESEFTSWHNKEGEAGSRARG